MGINKVILVGNVGKDPEVRRINNDTPVCSFSLATSETYRDKAGQKITTTEWHNIVMWRNLAEIAEKWVKKGSQIYIEGKIRTRSWDDKDGNKRYTTEIIADNMQLLGKAGDNPGSTQSAPSQASSASVANNSANTKPADTPFDPFDNEPDLNVESDDLPF